MLQSEWFKLTPVWSDICCFVLFFLSASNCKSSQKKKSKFLPHRSHPPVNESSISVQVVRILFHSVFLLTALICFPLLAISKAEVSDWARCPRHVLWAFRVLGALFSLSPSGTWITNSLTNSLVPSSLSYFTKILVSLGGIDPPALRFTTKRAIALQKPCTEDMHLFTNATSPHNRKKYIVADK